MSIFSRLFSGQKEERFPALAELLDARGVPADEPCLNDELLATFDSFKVPEREAFADALASLHSKGLPLPPAWRDAQYELLPQVVPVWQGQRDPYHFRPCFDNLCKRLLVDGKPVPPEWLTLWDISEDEVESIAMEHLEEKTKDKPYMRQASGIYRSNFGDGLDASRILLPDCWSQLFPGQNTFVAIPRQDLMLVAPQVLLPKLVEAVGESLKESGRELLVATLYQWVGNKLMPASLQEPHPMIQPQREFRQTDSLAAYAAQAAELAKMGIGEPCHLGMVQTKQGRTLTVATWLEGKPALVPDSDLVGFVSSKGRPLGLYWRQTLPRLQRLKGDQVDIWGPRRLQFATFPSNEELGELECFAPAEVHAQILGQGASQKRPTPSGGAPQSRQSEAASGSASSNSPVPAHLRGLSLGMQDDED
ncbi:MAG: hypothetical protein LBC63_01960 [Holophagales bacterium]|jgi:hypothetical protein|nr:hypothetical protein [Holophagales bacterium]